MLIIQRKLETKRIISASLLVGAIYTIGVFELGREIGTVESSDLFRRQLRSLKDCGGHAKVLFGHVHMAKTGGTSLNGIMANKYERVCGHKGYSYDAFQDNEEAKMIVASGGTPEPKGRSRVFDDTMNEIGFDDCDYVSHETSHHWWITHFGDAKFHNIPMKLHVPCRDPIDHLMSQCNYEEDEKFVKQDLACDAATDEEYFQSVRDCFVYVNERFSNELLEHFDVKCYDFKQQFTGYIEHMGHFLENRRYETDLYVQRETNSPRDKDSECIWKRPDLLEKTKKYLVENVDYYGFCNKCLGSKEEVKTNVEDSVAAEVVNQAHVYN